MLTLGDRTPNHYEADVLIEDGLVAEVGPRLRARDAEIVDAADTIVMPGFVDTHRHLSRSLMRNAGVLDLAVATAPDRDRRPEDVYAATLIGLLGAAEAGITTVVDWSDGPGEAAFVDAALQAHHEAGLRTVYISGDGPAAARSHNAGDRTVLAYGSPEITGQSLDTAAAGWAEARNAGLHIHAHAGRNHEDAGTVATLGERGLLGPDVTLVHCSRLTEPDLDAIASSGAHVCLAPSTEMAGGLGAPPIQELIDRNLRPGLGVDDERLAPGDLLAQMRATISVQHAVRFDLKLAGKAGLPKLLTTRDVIKYGTIDGARAIGLGDTTGSIEPGKQADVVVLRTDRPNIHPINDPIGAVVWGMDTSNLDWVFVGGEAVMRNGELVADVSRARQLAETALGRSDGSTLMTNAPTGMER